MDVLEQLRISNGTAGAPALAFTGDTDTGMYLSGANNISFSTAAAVRFTIGVGVIIAEIQMQGASGAAGAPGYSFTGDSDTGLYRVTANTLGLSTSGAVRLQLGPSGQFGIGGANYGTSGQTIISGGGSSAPAWGTLGATAGGTGQTTYTTGDLLYASATNTLSKRAAGTDGYVLTMVSGVPAWAAPTGGSGTPGNPTASVGLAAVNGVATTYMRSDAAPPLDQGITPTWTGKHTFTGFFVDFSRNSYCGFQWNVPNDGTNEKNTQFYSFGDGTGSGFVIDFVSDDLATARRVMIATRTGIAVSTVELGNATDTPSIILRGSLSLPNITTSTSATTGANTLPANPVGFITVNIGGTNRKIPYYAT
jgi:hypothetical protein